MPKTPPPENQRGAAAWFIAAIQEDAGGSDEELLRLTSDAIEVGEDYCDQLRDLRDGAARRLRDEGMSMKRIAKLARVTDSALTRRILKGGATRRVDRRRQV